MCVLKPSTITLCLSNARLFGATCLYKKNNKKKLLALSVFRRPMKPLIFFVWSSLALQRRLLNNFQNGNVWIIIEFGEAKSYLYCSKICFISPTLNCWASLNFKRSHFLHTPYHRSTIWHVRSSTTVSPSQYFHLLNI